MRIVIELFGGVVNEVYADSKSGKITDVVFLEDPKYCTEGGETRVKSGDAKDKVVIWHLGSVDVDRKLVSQVMEAAERRLRKSRRPAKGC
jgi:hypothetical protein